MSSILFIKKQNLYYIPSSSQETLRSLAAHPVYTYLTSYLRTTNLHGEHRPRGKRSAAAWS